MPIVNISLTIRFFSQIVKDGSYFPQYRKVKISDDLVSDQIV